MGGIIGKTRIDLGWRMMRKAMMSVGRMGRLESGEGMVGWDSKMLDTLLSHCMALPHRYVDTLCFKHVTARASVFG